jgi:hypothetical protein
VMCMLKQPGALVAALAAAIALVGGAAHAATGSGSGSSTSQVTTPLVATTPTDTAPSRADGHHCHDGADAAGSGSTAPDSVPSSSGSNGNAPAL